MVILNTKKEELHWLFLLVVNTKSQATFFAAYNWTQISPLNTQRLHCLKEDGAFWFYIDTCQMNTSKLAIYCTLMPTCRALLTLHSFFSAYALLGTYLLTAYIYKCMRLLTRVYVFHCFVFSLLLFKNAIYSHKKLLLLIEHRNFKCQYLIRDIKDTGVPYSHIVLGSHVAYGIIMY